MYAQYWNLECQPFESNQDPAFFYSSRTHQAALLKLRYLLDSGKAVGVLGGNTGIGKSYLVRLLAHEAEESFGPFIHVRYPVLSPSELIAWLAVELGSEAVARDRELTLDRSLREFEIRLQHFTRQHRQPVIVIDEAHLIDDPAVFQTLQLLLNFRDETPFTLLLCGQRTLLARLARMPEFEERIGVKALLQPFSREETAEYIQTRLSVAGLDEAVFDQAALQEIHELSGGIPRRINRMADLAMLVGFADGLRTLTSREIGSVAEEIGLTMAQAE